VRELAVVSGKGGTGKTSIVASFAALAGANGRAVLADCDVDAADLHLVLAPEVKRREEFRAGRVARIRPADCTGCGKCAELCRFDAVRRNAAGSGERTFSVDGIACEGCGVCVWFCPAAAIDFPEKVSGEWFVSETRFGPLVHARLGIAEENSGKLVSRIRREARDIAEREGRGLIIADGSPGIGCPVIASLAGADMALLVAEPTVSGIHDMQRVADLCAQLGVRAAVSVNKSDVNPEMTARIEAYARERSLARVGRVPYDEDVTKAQIEGRSVVEFSEGPAAEAVRALWERVEEALEGGAGVAPPRGGRSDG
jgi:MinD superfamily P-loop ATPase